MYEIKNSNIIKIKIQDPLLKMKGVFSFNVGLFPTPPPISHTNNL